MTSSVRRIRWVLRLTALVALVQGLGHAVLFITAQPRHGEDEVAVLQAMRARAFDFGGFAPHSYWDLYYGYGLLAVVFAFFIAALLWLASGLAEQPRQLWRFVGCVGATVAAHAAIIARYFFLLPLEFDILVLVGIVVSLALSRNPLSATTERVS